MGKEEYASSHQLDSNSYTPVANQCTQLEILFRPNFRVQRISVEDDNANTSYNISGAGSVISVTYECEGTTNGPTYFNMSQADPGMQTVWNFMSPASAIHYFVSGPDNSIRYTDDVYTLQGETYVVSGDYGVSGVCHDASYNIGNQYMRSNIRYMNTLDAFACFEPVIIGRIRNAHHAAFSDAGTADTDNSLCVDVDHALESYDETYFDDGISHGNVMWSGPVTGLPIRYMDRTANNVCGYYEALDENESISNQRDRAEELHFAANSYENSHVYGSYCIDNPSGDQQVYLLDPLVNPWEESCREGYLMTTNPPTEEYEGNPYAYREYLMGQEPHDFDDRSPNSSNDGGYPDWRAGLVDYCHDNYGVDCVEDLSQAQLQEAINGYNATL